MPVRRAITLVQELFLHVLKYHPDASTKIPVSELSPRRTFLVECRNTSRPFYLFPPSIPSSSSHSHLYVAAILDAVIRNRDFVNTRLLLHKNVTISVDEWILETTHLT